jgi:hypothetical protein
MTLVQHKHASVKKYKFYALGMNVTIPIKFTKNIKLYLCTKTYNKYITVGHFREIKNIYFIQHCLFKTNN